MAKKEDLIKEFGEAEMRSSFVAPTKPLIISSAIQQPDDPADRTQTETQPSDEETQPSGEEAKPKTTEQAEGRHSSSSHQKKKKHKFFRAVVNIFSDRTFCKMLNAFLFCLIVNAFEYFFLIHIKHITTQGAVGKIFGVIVVFVFMYSTRLKPRNLGLPPDPRLILNSLKRALMFTSALIPAYLIDMLLVLVKHGSPHLTVYAYGQPYSEVGIVDWAANILLLIVINALSAFMLEFLFRGIIMRMGRAKFGFGQTAFIVSLFYSLWYLLIPLSKLVGGSKPSEVLPLCVFYLIFEFILSFKWCLCVRATGAVWLPIFDHFIFITATGLLRVVDNVVTTGEYVNHIDENKYVRYVIYLVVSFILCYLYYKKKMMQRKKKNRSRGSHSRFLFDSLADMNPDDIASGNTSSAVRKDSVDEDSIDENYKEYLNKRKTSDSQQH